MYKIGIVGYGGFGAFLHVNWQQLDNVQVSAVCDIREDLELTGVTVFQDVDAFLRSDIDIVSIVTPPATHVELALRAIKAGKHVLIEKPMALTVEEVRLLIQESRDHGVQITTNYMLRFNPLVRLVKEVVDLQYAGELLHVSVVNIAQDESLPLEHWFWNKADSGGIFTEHAVHFFDLVYFISGQPAIEVEGFSSWRNNVQEDKVMGSVRHRGGLLANHYHAFCRPGFLEKTSLRFVFDLGEIELIGWIPLELKYEGLCGSGFKELLLNIDHVNFTHKESIESVQDDSRPDGWGELDFAGKLDKSDEEPMFVRAEAALSPSKAEVYGDCVRSSLSALIKQIEGSGEAYLDDMSLVESIKIAERLRLGA